MTEHLAALKSAADPGRVAADLGLRGRGRRFFCPVCQSDGNPHKTPDLSVGPKGFVCFKCGLKGDLLKLIEVAGGKSFPDAVRWLEDLTGIRPAARPRGGYRDKGKVGIVAPARSWTPFSGAVGGKRAESGPGTDPAVLDAFLTACQPIAGAPPSTSAGRVRAWLKAKVPNMTDALVEGLRLRFCGKEYLNILDGLKADFGEDALTAAGLLKRSKTGRAVPSFWHYWTRKTGFLVIPYLVAGRPVYLKVRPPISKEGAERRRLVRFLNTSAAVPCLYNVDALAAQPLADKVLVCEGESDTWAALSYGFAAVGSPGARSFKPDWIEAFRPFVDPDGRSKVILTLDADKAGKEGARTIASRFRKCGLPMPLSLAIPEGKDLSEYLQRNSPNHEHGKGAESVEK